MKTIEFYLTILSFAVFYWIYGIFVQLQIVLIFLRLRWNSSDLCTDVYRYKMNSFMTCGELQASRTTEFIHLAVDRYFKTTVRNFFYSLTLCGENRPWFLWMTTLFFIKRYRLAWLGRSPYTWWHIEEKVWKDLSKPIPRVFTKTSKISYVTSHVNLYSPHRIECSGYVLDLDATSTHQYRWCSDRGRSSGR